ncbi:MAG TPA: hypothetical protein VMG10_16625 [Gemmataceae bacterium]|nr:hypothetical protein [Gemmataceae bacterium]
MLSRDLGIDIENLEAIRVNLSSSADLLVQLRWLALLHGKLRASLACTGGVHSATDAIKAVMAGARRGTDGLGAAATRSRLFTANARRYGTLARGTRVRTRWRRRSAA